SRSQSITTGQRFAGYDSSTVFHDINMNKKCVRLNLSKPEAIPLVKRLVGMADVVAQNMRPGVLERLGLGYEALAEVKPDIIMLSSSAVGSTGPHRSYVGYAPVFAALAGRAPRTGAPRGNPVPLYGAVDLRSATTSAFAVLAALHQRATTGEGQHIDLSSVESIASLIGHLVTEYQLSGLVPKRRGNDDVEMAPHNAYPCRDGRWVSISAANDREWEALCRVAGPRGWAEDPRFGTQRDRWRNRRALDRAVSEWTRDQAATKVTELLQAAGVPALPCFDEEDLAHNPQLEARGVFSTVHHEVLGDRDVLAPPWRLTGTPDVPQQPAPLLGEHSRYVLRDLLGLSEGKIEALEAAEVVY
ncbi:MAG: CaiB/BaiF CoA transferase family protein, partial [Dehalococcoidia bacterium]